MTFDPKLLNIPPTCTWWSVERFSRAGPRGRRREWATLGVYPLSWLLSNNRLEEVCGTLTTATFSSRLLLSNQDKGCTPSVAHSLPLPLPLGPALLNLWIVSKYHENPSRYIREEAADLIVDTQTDLYMHQYAISSLNFLFPPLFKRW